MTGQVRDFFLRVQLSGRSVPVTLTANAARIRDEITGSNTTSHKFLKLLAGAGQALWQLAFPTLADIDRIAGAICALQPQEKLRLWIYTDSADVAALPWGIPVHGRPHDRGLQQTRHAD